MNSGNEAIERIVHVIVNTIENTVRRDSFTITILVYHCETLLGESEPLRIEPDFREPPLIRPIDYRTSLKIIVTDRSNIDSVVSNPVLIQIVEHESDADSRPISFAAGDGKRRDKTRSGEKPAGKGPKIIGLCNMDIIPILLGEKNIVERLVVEEPKTFTSAAGTSWLNLPILTVTLIQEDENFLSPDLLANYLSITVESIHNPPAYFTEGFEYKAATIVHIDGEDPETVIFNDGKFCKYRDVELTKRWRTLSKLEGRGRLSKYKIECDYGDTRNPLENFDFKKIIEKDNPRIEWNYLSRHILLPGGQETMAQKLNKYRHWPFQFRITTNVSDGGKSRSKDWRPQLYQCYVNASELLYPGRTRARAIAQLYGFNGPEMMEKTGFDKSLFTDATTETKPKENKKGKLGAKGSSVNLASTEFESLSSSPLTNEAGAPVFVVIEFELQVPIVASRKIDNVIVDLHELLGPPDKLSPYPYTGDLAEEQYINSIRNMVETITESYRDFNEEDEKSEVPCPASSSESKKSATSGKKYSYIPDEIDRFTQYLYETGTYFAVQTTLRKRIVRLLDQKFKMQTCTWNSEECQNFVANAYLYLVEQMHVAINGENDFHNETFNGTENNFCYYAEESYELGNIERARNNYTGLIAKKRDDPEPWLKYAIFLKKINDTDRAVQCCREAINLDSRHKLGLLLYGVILAQMEKYSAAEILLKAAAQLYPRFAEAWLILHLFFHRIEYFPGVDLTIRVGEQCLIDRNRDKVHLDCLENEPLAWSTIHCPKNRVYLITAVFLLKLNLFDFAGIALAHELSLAGRSTSWLYYMAVHHYLLGRYDDALTHLEEARQKHGIDYSIGGLMGHCYYKIGEKKLAIECYEYASTLFDRPVDIHLIDIRLGNYSLEAEEYSRGKRTFLNVCKSSPTSNSWLGLGIACYHMMDFKDAEAALNEANRLDHNNPEIWAHLCLLNMSLQRYDEFAECYRQTVKNDLQNAKLWLRITNKMESLGLSSPMLVTTESQHKMAEEKS